MSVPRALLPALLGGSLSACLGVAELSPAGGLPSPLEDAAAAQIDGVELTAQAERWPGEVPIEREVTPMRIVLRNDGDRPVRFRYEDVTLVDVDGGDVYRALPPLSIEGSVKKPRAVYERPGFDSERFRVAPHHAWHYPHLDPWPHGFAYDDLYYDSWYGRWGEVRLPTPDMLSSALPEGVVQAGGFIDGWIYFERLPDERALVELRFRLVDAESEELIGVATVPFTVD